MTDSTVPVLSTLNVPAAIPFPSVRCLQWSDDGQLLFATKSAVYILTPQPGISFDVASVIRSAASQNVVENWSIGWYHNLIDIEKLTPTKWPDYSQGALNGWGAVSFGSLDVAVKAVCPSPTNRSESATCVLAILTSNMDLSIWGPSKDILKGEWSVIHDYTSHTLTTSKPTAIQDVLELQITYRYFLDKESGTRAGSLLLFRLDDKPSLDVQEKISVHDGWVTQISVSSWTPVDPLSYFAMVAVATPSNRIVLLKLEQTLSIVGPEHSLSRQYTIDIRIGPLNELAISAPPATGGMVWIEPPGRSPILVFGTPGIVHLWSLGLETNGNEVSHWSGQRQLRLETQSHPGQSSLRPISGAHYIARQDVLIISLFDGSFHAIHGFSTNPSFSPTTLAPTNHENTENVSSKGLSLRVRRTFEACEPIASTPRDVCRIGGMAGYDDSTFIWLHEACRPSDFSYKHEAKHNCMLITAQLLDDGHNDDTLLRDLQTVFTSTQVSHGLSPHKVLRPVYHRLQRPEVVDRLHNHLLQLITPEPHSEALEPLGVSSTDGLSDRFRRSFRQSLKEHLFGLESVQSYRVRLALADYIWKHYTDPEKQQACGQIAQTLLDHISHHILRTSLRHLLAVVPVLQETDIPFISRLIVQTLLPRCPPDILILRDSLINLINSSNISIHVSADSLTPTSLNENCPACCANVPLENITNARSVLSDVFHTLHDVCEDMYRVHAQSADTTFWINIYTNK
ncbi:hypothetical protein ONZ45_g15439 [Pleurotus djamor]|nr:hypothetical protein ONZ45_g15439 [Pleurotus djamor]